MTRAQNNQTSNKAQESTEEPRIFRLLPGRTPASESAHGHDSIFGWKSAGMAFIAVLLGMIAMLAGSFKHRCSAEINVVGVPEDTVSEYRRLLLDVAQTVSESGKPAVISDWTVTSDMDPHVFDLAFTATPMRRSTEALDHLLTEYSKHLEEIHTHEMNTPSVAELLLSKRIKGQQEELATLVAMSTSGKQNSAVDPRPKREAIRHILDEHRDTYENLHKELLDALKEQKKLQTVPLARSGRLTPEEQAIAQQMDIRLTQDRKAIAVRLADAKAELLSIQKRTSPLLDDLLTISRSVAGSELSGDTAGNLSPEYQTAADSFTNAAETYAGIISDFSRKWNDTFNKLQALDTKEKAELLNMQKTLSKCLGDVLYDTVESLSEMQEQITVLSTASENAARFHTLVAGLQRGMQKIRTAHRQFEFTASDVRTLNNPRLDASIKTARSLNRRIQDRIETLDKNLEEKAYQQAIKDREERLTELTDWIATLREKTDAQVAGLLASHDEYTETNNRFETFIVEKMSSDQRIARIGEVKKEISTAQQELEHLQNHRQSRIIPSAVKVISRNIDTMPSNLAERIGWGWLVTATTLLTMLLGQWIVGYRRKQFSS